jgi:1A family penicillin-binding protein
MAGQWRRPSRLSRLSASLRIDDWRATPAARVGLVLLILALVAFIPTFAWMARHAAAIHQLTRGVGDTVFHARDGRPWFRLDETRRDTPLDRIAPSLRQAVVAIEDRRFLWHPGIDPLAMLRAAARNIGAGGVVEGGSTITQQLARTLFLSNRRTVARKVQEAALAVMLEHQLTKDQILELYLNRVYLGANTYGIGTMSMRLFGKHPQELTLGEAALVAGLIRAPASLSPWSNPAAALARRDTVLARMRQQEFITAAQESAAKAERIRIREEPRLAAGSGYLQEYLRDQFRSRFGGDHPVDWRVVTTAIPEVQREAEMAVRAWLDWFGIPGLQAALVALDPKTGDVLALVGGRGVVSAPFNRATLAARQPGSAFKPFVYAAALERGHTPVSRVSGLAAMPAIGPNEWIPANANGVVEDTVTIRDALVESNNRAAVRMQQTIGARPVIGLADRAGLDDMPDVPSLALGTGLVSPLQLTAAYAVFANGGHAIEPRALAHVIDRNGSVVLNTQPERDRVLSEDAAFQMLSILTDVVDRGTGSAARSYGVTFPVGGKTGSTDQHKDAWFVGFSSSVVTGVWVGFDHPQPIAPDAYGARYALPIWSQFMTRTARLLPPRAFTPPETIRRGWICSITGLRARERCPAYEEFFKEHDSLPAQCDLHEGDFRRRADGRSVWACVWGSLAGLIGGRGDRPPRDAERVVEQDREERDERPRRKEARGRNDADSDSDSDGREKRGRGRGRSR